MYNYTAFPARGGPRANPADLVAGYRSFYGATLCSMCRHVAYAHLALCVVYAGLELGGASEALGVRQLRVPLVKHSAAWVANGLAASPPVLFNTSVFHAFDASTCAAALGAARGIDADLMEPSGRCEAAPARLPSKAPGYYLQPVAFRAGEVNTALCIVFFHLLSFVFQVASASDEDSYSGVLAAGRSFHARMYEYSLSATVMTVAMCAQLNVLDVFSVVNVAVLTWACMIFGVVAEMLFEAECKSGLCVWGWMVPGHFVAHWGGWVTLGAAYLTMASNLGVTLDCFARTLPRVPRSVWALLIGEFAMFSSFGLVQGVRLWDAPFLRPGGSSAPWPAGGGLLTPLYMRQSDPVARRVLKACFVEYCYVLLSLVAKTFLGAVVFFGNREFNNA